MATVFCTKCGSALLDTDLLCSACREPNKAIAGSPLPPLTIPATTRKSSQRRTGIPSALIGGVLVAAAAAGAFAYQHVNEATSQPPADTTLADQEADYETISTEELPPPADTTMPPGVSTDVLDALDFSQLADQSDDLSSQAFIGYATILDEWSRFDFFQLVLLPEAEQKAKTYALLGDPQGADLWLQQQTSYLMDAARTIQAHPDWSSNDVVQEVTDSFVLGRVVDRGMIEYLHEHGVGYDHARTRQAKLAQTYQRCLTAIADIAPSRRPPAPEAACKRAILSRGQPEKIPTAGNGADTLSNPRSPPRSVKVRAAPDLEYPAGSLRAREQGNVLVEVCAAADGRVRSVELSKSSGFSRLDQAAQKWMRQALVEIPDDAKSDADRCRLQVKVTFVLP